MGCIIRRPCLALAEAGWRLGPPQVWNFAFGNRPKQHRSHPAMPPQCPATPRTADIWLPKATDSTSALKTLAAPQPPQSSSSNGASVASHAQDPVTRPGPSNGASVASQAQDSSSMASESDGWHLGLEAGPVFVQQWRLRGQPAVIWLPKATDGTSAFKTLESDGWHLVQQWRLRGQSRPGPSNGASVASQAQPGQQFYGFRKRRMAPPSPRPAHENAPDGTSALKTLATPPPAQSSSSTGASVASQAQDSSYMASESDGWHLGLAKLRRACARQWRQSLA